MIKREVVGRYKGSIMGIFWAFFNPVFMLAIYTFVFSVVFKARWGVGESETKAQFAVVLFAGLIVFNFFSEVVNRAPGLIISNVNYVKKVVFPLEILPIVSIGSALFHTAISLCVLLAGFFIFNGFLHATVLLIPFVFIPLIIFIAGLAWILASLGVFIRDLGQAMGLVTTTLIFLSPVFYSVGALPEKFQPALMANPLTFIIEQARGVLIYGHFPDWIGLTIYTAVAVLVAWLGFVWFQKTRKGFSDVL